VNKPVQDYSQSSAAKQNKVQQSYNIGNVRYTPQKVENVQYHPRVEDSSAKIPACLNRQSSTLIYSSDSGDLGEELSDKIIIIVSSLSISGDMCYCD